ncbi:hypothetical protein M0R36_03925 [bacterium]|jgi:sarcosine oxidase delta subunit|nr:hypothetical protein [bacterium]
MKEIKCPICNKRISSDVLTVKLHTEEHIVEEVKKNHPEWIEKDGVCPICLEHYKKLFRKKIDSHQKKKR